MSSILSDIESALVSQISTQIPTLKTCMAIGDLQTALDFSSNVLTPAVLVSFAGEQAKPTDTIGMVSQETEMQWSCFVSVHSFAAEEEGRLSANEIIDQLLSPTCLLGFPISTAIRSKIEFVQTRRLQITEASIVYEVRVRHGAYRQGA